MTGEEWFAEVGKTESDKDSLAIEVFEEDVLNVSRFALADGEEAEDFEEEETEDPEYESEAATEPVKRSKDKEEKPLGKAIEIDKKPVAEAQAEEKAREEKKV